MRPAGIEPATIRLEGGCSVRLSYGRFAAIVPAAASRPQGVDAPTAAAPEGDGRREVRV